jgi:hypothetical protein
MAENLQTGITELTQTIRVLSTSDVDGVLKLAGLYEPLELGNRQCEIVINDGVQIFSRYDSPETVVSTATEIYTSVLSQGTYTTTEASMDTYGLYSEKTGKIELVGCLVGGEVFAQVVRNRQGVHPLLMSNGGIDVVGVVDKQNQHPILVRYRMLEAEDQQVVRALSGAEGFYTWFQAARVKRDKLDELGRIARDTICLDPNALEVPIHNSAHLHALTERDLRTLHPDSEQIFSGDQWMQVLGHLDDSNAEDGFDELIEKLEQTYQDSQSQFVREQVMHEVGNAIERLRLEAAETFSQVIHDPETINSITELAEETISDKLQQAMQGSPKSKFLYARSSFYEGQQRLIRMVAVDYIGELLLDHEANNMTLLAFDQQTGMKAYTFNDGYVLTIAPSKITPGFYWARFDHFSSTAEEVREYWETERERLGNLKLNI